MAKKNPTQPFTDAYPNIAAWVTSGDSWIEIGQNDYCRSLIRVLDIGGMVWEGEEDYATVDEALEAAEAAIANWFDENALQGKSRR